MNYTYLDISTNMLKTTRRNLIRSTYGHDSRDYKTEEGIFKTFRTATGQLSGMIFFPIEKDQPASYFLPKTP